MSVAGLIVCCVVQPYRTLPLVQPSAKARADLGVGSISHLKMQDDHITGDKQPQLAPQNQALAAKAKHDELVMKQKVRRPLVAALGSVDGQGGGEEEGNAMQGGREGGAAVGKREGGEQRVSPLRKNSGVEATGAATGGGKVKDDFMKINKTTFKVGGQIVQLKDPGKNETLEEPSRAGFSLRRRSAVDTEMPDLDKQQDLLQLAPKPEEERRLSLGYEVTTSRLEELEDDVVLTLPEAQYSKEEEPEAEYTFSLPKPIEREVNTMEVEETVKLVIPKPVVQPEVRTVNVRETVRIRRTYYIP